MHWSDHQMVTLNTLNSTYNKKKYAEILLRYRWLFIKDDVFIGHVFHSSSHSLFYLQYPHITQIELINYPLQ